MRKIYIVLTYTGTLLSKLIKVYTGEEYAHVSISFSKNLTEMYSFGRLNPYNPFRGGFVRESIHHGTFKRFRKTKTAVYSLEVDEEQFSNMKEVVDYITENRRKYRFNVIGLFAVALHLRVKREKCFYCAEFVKYVLDCSKLKLGLPELIKPNDFQYLYGLKKVYSGFLREYNLKI